MTQRRVLLPRDNKFVDGDGKILPAWRSVLERFEPLSKLTSAEIDSLVSLLEALTGGEDPFITADGTINFDVPELDVALSLLENGTTKSTQTDVGDLHVDFRRGLTVSAAGLVSVETAPRQHFGNIVGPLNVPLPGTGSLSLGGAYTIAVPVWVEKPFSMTYAGGLVSVGGGVGGNRSFGIYTDENGVPGTLINGELNMSYGRAAGQNLFEVITPMTLTRGFYWFAMAYSGWAGFVLAAGTVDAHLGYFKSGVTVTPIGALTRTSTGGTLNANESTSDWAGTSVTPLPFLYVI